MLHVLRTINGCAVVSTPGTSLSLEKHLQEPMQATESHGEHFSPELGRVGYDWSASLRKAENRGLGKECRLEFGSFGEIDQDALLFAAGGDIFGA